MAIRPRRSPGPATVLAAMVGLLTLGSTSEAHGAGEYLSRPQGPYSGRVLDATTERPVAGAGIFVFWEYEDTRYPGVWMALSQVEASTNDRGEFFVDSAVIEMKLPPRSLQPALLIFKPGYRHYPASAQYPAGAPARLFAGQGTVVRLQPVKTEEERIDAASEFLAAAKQHKAHGPMFLALVDGELKRLTTSKVDWEATARRPAPQPREDQPCVTDPARVPPPPPSGWMSRTPGGLYLEGYHGPYRGRVVDAETGQPIQGAVVMAVWSREVALIVQSNTYFYEACEALTNENGEFVIDAKKVEEGAPRKVRRAHFEAFAPGYSMISVPPETERKFTTGDIEGGPVVWGLAKLATREERLQVVRSLPGGLVPRERVPNVIRLLNVERTNLGLPLYESAGAGQ